MSDFEDSVPDDRDANNGAADQPVTPPNSAANPFDPATLRLPQDLSAAAGVKKVLRTVPVRKPDKSWFSRVHPDEKYRLQTKVIELQGENKKDIYLVDKALWPELEAEPTFKSKLLATAINRQGVVFLWEVNLPRSDGRLDEWSRSSIEAINMATTEWVRVTSSPGLGAYEISTAVGKLGEPAWPDLPFAELLRIAFQDRYIREWSHPELRKLRGEV